MAKYEGYCRLLVRVEIKQIKVGMDGLVKIAIVEV